MSDKERRPAVEFGQDRVHELKIWPEFFEAQDDGRKPWEVRTNDRDYRVGDKLLLKEWSPETGCCTGRLMFRVITYMCDLPGMDGFVGMTTEWPEVAK